MRKLLLCLLLFFSVSCGKQRGPQGKVTGIKIGQPGPECHEAKNIVGGIAHVCAHLKDDRAICWGRNDEGQCDLSTARNAQRLIYDISNAKFLKIAAEAASTCVIMAEEPYKGIPFCFGEEGPWLDVPHEPVIDISTWEGVTCFIKASGHLGCVGRDIYLFNKDADRKSPSPTIRACDLIKHGVDPFTKEAHQDFSAKKFKRVQVSSLKVCAQGAEDDIVYCMGYNLHGSSESRPHAVLDFYAQEHNGLHYLNEQGQLFFTHIGSNNLIANIPDPYDLKYKKIVGSPHALSLLTKAGNSYLDKTPMPENTLITFWGFAEENVLDAVTVESSFAKDRYQNICMIKDNYQVKCISLVKRKDNKIINDIPNNIAF